MKFRKWFLMGTIMLCLMIGFSAYCGYKLIKFEKKQTQQIEELQSAIINLNAQIKMLTEEKEEWLDDGFNYLAIGNSITRHGIDSYWWNEVGMAASDENHDYYHLVLEYLAGQNDDMIKGVPYNFFVWETQNRDRNETLICLDRYLSPKLNLVTLQLGENVSDLETYREDYISLLEYIKKKAPNAEIIVVGDFWSNDNRDEIKQSAAEETGVAYVSLEGIKENEQYYCGIGTTVYDKDGNPHLVDHEGVAKHPGDSGMQAIADRIIDVLKK